MRRDYIKAHIEKEHSRYFKKLKNSKLYEGEHFEHIELPIPKKTKMTKMTTSARLSSSSESDI